MRHHTVRFVCHLCDSARAVLPRPNAESQCTARDRHVPSNEFDLLYFHSREKEIADSLTRETLCILQKLLRDFVVFPGSWGL